MVPKRFCANGGILDEERPFSYDKSVMAKIAKSRVKLLCCFLLLAAAGTLGAQQFNSVPLGHPAYDIIEMGVLRGIIALPPSAKPWPEFLVKEKLAEMENDWQGQLTSRESEIVAAALSLFDRRAGFDYSGGRYRVEESLSSFETGLNWESVFSVGAPDASVASVNMAEIYLAGDIGKFFSCNFPLMGGFLYIGRNELGRREQPDNSLLPVYGIQSSFFASFSKQWDGWVLLPSDSAVYHPWPDAFALAWGTQPEFNAAFFDRRFLLRAGRIRHEWGAEVNGSSLALNSQARPFAALEGTITPLQWLDFSFLSGGLEYFRDDSQWPKAAPFKNAYSIAQVEFNTRRFLHFDLGGAAVWPQQPNLALFANLELRLPGVLRIWGGVFVDSLESLGNDFAVLPGNTFAYQAGLKSNITWLPFAALTVRYTKIEPYCYTHAGGADGWLPADGAYINGGESLGHYLPPNSNEFLVRLEALLFPALKAHIQFQMIQHGADYGDFAVPGSSLRDSIDRSGNPAAKYFLMDGVYEWNTILKIGGTLRLAAGPVPLAVYAETGLAGLRFTKNGNAGVGSEGDYEGFTDDTYRARTGFIFSIGFKVYP